MDARHVGARCQLGLYANRVALVPGRIQVVHVVSDSDSSLVDAVGEAVAEAGPAKGEMTGPIGFAHFWPGLAE
jgi:hypothetical protein